MHSCQCMPPIVGFCNEKSTDLVDEGGEAVVEGHDLVLLLSADGLDGGVDRQVEGGEQTLVDGDSCDGWCYESTTSTTHGQSVATTTSAESQATSSEPQATYTSTEAAAEASTTSADAGTTSADAVAVAGAGATATTSQGQATTADGAAGEAPPHAAAAAEAATATATAAQSG